MTSAQPIVQYFLFYRVSECEIGSVFNINHFLGPQADSS